MWVKGIIFWVTELGYQVEAAWRPTLIVLQGFMAIQVHNRTSPFTSVASFLQSNIPFSCFAKFLCLFDIFAVILARSVHLSIPWLPPKQHKLCRLAQSTMKHSALPLLRSLSAYKTR